MGDSNFVNVLFEINGKKMKVRVKTKNARKQLRIGDFKNYVFQKCKTHFNDELANYVWKLYNKDLKKYLWANDNVMINDDDKVKAAIKENMTMLVINPNTLSRTGSEEYVSRYEVEINERRPTKRDSTGNGVSKSSEESSPTNKKTNSVVSMSQLKQRINNLKEVKEGKVESPTNSATMKTPSSPKSKDTSIVSSGRHIDIKPLLISLVKNYNQEFNWIAKKSGAVTVDDENFDGVWDLIASDVNNKLSFANHEYSYQECKEQFGLLFNLYISIISDKNAKRIDDWQFFKMFHNELDLTPFDEKIDELKRNFDKFSAVEKTI